MQRVQVFLRNDQCEALGRLAKLSGVAKSDLIRQGVELFLRKQQQAQTDWKQATRQLYGIWEDRNDLETTHQHIRQSLNARLDRFAHE
ncbi:MAG: ribbon-helix-helix domain-containing protein [Thiothrix sp.]|jgi:Arc/MetJ-type ribon-helix-helix transcriptional regulator|uniref:ribbon-helix-helix domain-containing protein n=1 Tax=Thiothrix sp. TaxID=1032 RepID=UPI0026145E38|nr:ribbon-helix-helix domain-containing protein [Thiothrix sp.]MDD5392548.1 ribbon-helix-helix domain-containing protein [Thiothrix sp.]